MFIYKYKSIIRKNPKKQGKSKETSLRISEINNYYPVLIYLNWYPHYLNTDLYNNISAIVLSCLLQLNIQGISNRAHYFIYGGQLFLFHCICSGISPLILFLVLLSYCSLCFTGTAYYLAWEMNTQLLYQQIHKTCGLLSVEQS